MSQNEEAEYYGLSVQGPCATTSKAETFLEDFQEIVPRYYVYSDVCSYFFTYKLQMD